MERLNAIPPSKGFTFGALCAGGGTMLAMEVARAEMAAANYALVSPMLRIHARSERSVAILMDLLKECEVVPSLFKWLVFLAIRSYTEE